MLFLILCVGLGAACSGVNHTTSDRQSTANEIEYALNKEVAPLKYAFPAHCKWR